MKDYQIYQNTDMSSPNGTGLYVRINPKGTFTFNAGATRLFEAEKIKTVFLLWDAKSRSVAFRAAEENAPGSFRLNSDCPELRLRQKSFFREVGWDVKTTTTFKASWDAQEKRLELEPLAKSKEGDENDEAATRRGGGTGAGAGAPAGNDSALVR